MLPPAVIVRGLAEARLALAPGLPVTLLSAPAAACHAGVGFWQALVAAARAEFPGAAMVDVLDCGEAGGRALEALRAGVGHLVLRPACPVRASVLARAAAQGAVVLAEAPAAFEWPVRRAESAYWRGRMEAWLQKKDVLL